jgi:Holliday junction resolvasome RuvABC endonuclease subunit
MRGGQYTSNEVKQGLVGYGAATKDQVQRMVAKVLGLAAARARPTWPMRWRWPSAT